MMKRLNRLSISAVAVALTLMGAAAAWAQQSAPAAAGGPEAWTYKSKKLDRAAVEALLARPEKLLVIDVRRPDEVTQHGGFPVYLSIQAKELENRLAYIPRDRTILTVSNHAHRAGAAADLLAAKGFRVAGAAGSDDYVQQGGTITKVVPPPAAPSKK